MNNQAAQTMPLPPSLPEWSRMDDLGGAVPSEVRQALIAMYQQGYAAALSQTAGVAVDLEQFRKPVQFWMAHAKTMMPGMSTTATHEGPRLLSLIDAQAAAPAASGVDTSTNEAWVERAQEKIAAMDSASGGESTNSLVSSVEAAMHACYMDHDDYRLTTTLLHDMAIAAVKVVATTPQPSAVNNEPGKS